MNNLASNPLGLILLQSSLQELDVLITGSGAIPNADFEEDSSVANEPKGPGHELYVSFKNPKVYDVSTDLMNPNTGQNLSQPKAKNILQDHFSRIRIGIRNVVIQLKKLFGLG